MAGYAVLVGETSAFPEDRRRTETDVRGYFSDSRPSTRRLYSKFAEALRPFTDSTDIRLEYYERIKAENRGVLFLYGTSRPGTTCSVHTRGNR